ncbi:hypothetical protein B566_EDAN012302 [Ephemera danica]|nr:hypothetical protein B566_EDAN012302 [Ephemera danica]
MKRCHLGIKEKYLMPEYQHKLEAYEHPSPFSYLFAEDTTRCGSSSVLIERLHTNEKVRHMVAAQVVIPEHEISGELLVGETCLYFVPEELEAVSCGPCSTLEQQHHGSVAWQFEEIREIHPRRFQLQERAVEVFLTNGKTYFLAFPTLEDKNVPADTLSDVLQLWREGIISNFEYLSQLNKMAGRSFNDLMQYPVFPFVLADYTSPRLDLATPAVYRNFERPMAVQNKKNEQHYVDTYNYLKQELQTGQTTIYLNQEPHHFGSHYSNSGTVLHFLVRMPPFTRMFLRYQDNNFDIPDRTFHSLYTTWRLTSSDSTTDVKELIPEFFFLPEFLLNTEGFSLGALESDYVRENLPHWIDLVFGYKQTGKPAVDAINVFHPATYYGFDSSTIKDPLERKAWETMVRTYGQTPRQLFRTPHPMVVQALASKDSKGFSAVPLPLGGAVQNLRWGSYVGSPTEGEPHIAWKHVHRTPVAGLVPLRNNDVFGLAPCTSLLLVYNGKGGFLGSPSVQGAALVSWSHADGVVRAKLRKDQPLRPLVQCPSLDPVLLCASTPDVPQLWLALASGRLLVLRFPLHATKGVLEPCEAPCQLLGHEERVLTLSICRAFSIAVSGSRDGTAIIWDINTLSYVRTIPSVSAPVQLVTVSDVSGDIATTCPANLEQHQGSCLRLYTVNASLIGKVMCEEQITTLCFSCAPEGSSINVIAAGLSSGDVRMWNTWDLASVRKITCDLLNCAIISLVYSHDAQHLYASAADGTVVIWETSGARGKTAKFLNLTSL